MKLLFVHDNAGVCQSLATALNLAGHEAQVIARKELTKDLSLGSEYVKNVDTYKLIPTLFSIIDNRRIDVINSNNYTSWIAAEISKRILKVPHVVILHGDDIRNLVREQSFLSKEISCLKHSKVRP